MIRFIVRTFRHTTNRNGNTDTFTTVISTHNRNARFSFRDPHENGDLLVRQALKNAGIEFNWWEDVISELSFGLPIKLWREMVNGAEAQHMKEEDIQSKVLELNEQWERAIVEFVHPTKKG